MSDETKLRVVFRTSQSVDASALSELLADAHVPFEIRIVVPEDREEAAIAVIEAHMKSIGAAPNEERPEPSEAEALLPCPNCEALGITLHRPCRGCGYDIVRVNAPPVTVKSHAPAARSFCPECRGPLTHAAGKCRACAEELEPLEAADLLCPTLEHVLYRDTVGGYVCKACKRVWVDLAPA